MMVDKVNFRSIARMHYCLANEALAMGDDFLPLAAVRLRMVIECYVYEILQPLVDDAPEVLRATYQGGQLIKRLKVIDSTLEESRAASIYINEHGKLAGFSVNSANLQGEDQMRPLGTDFRLKTRWVDRNYNALGKFLHEPTIKEHYENGAIKIEAMRKKLETISAELDKVVNSSLYNLTIRETVTFRCECGSKIVRRTDALEVGMKLVCGDCKAIWEIEEVEGELHLAPTFVKIGCSSCGELNSFPAKELREGNEYCCKKCNSNLVLERVWRTKLKSDENSRYGFKAG